MRKAKLIISVLFLLLATQTFSFADGEMNLARSELTLFAEIPMVALPTRIPQPIEEAPAAISVISKQQIAESGYTKIWDFFRSQPGMSVMELSGNVMGVAVRGFNTKYGSNKLGVFMDGRSLFNPLTQGTFWVDQPIILDDIERIEIMRGPNSVLYGFNAVSGVISIVTKDPEDTLGLRMGATGGSNGTQNYYTSYSGQSDDLSYRISVEKDNSLGYGDDSGKQFLDSKRLKTANFRAKYNLDGEDKIEVLGGLKTGHRGATPINAGTDVGVKSSYQIVRYTDVMDDDSELKLQLNHTEWILNMDTVSAALLAVTDGTDDQKYRQFDVDAQYSFKAFDTHNIVAGLNWRRNEVRHLLIRNATDAFVPQHDTIMRAFLQDTIPVTDQFTYYSGIEWEQNNYTGSDWSIRQTGMYEVKPGHFLRATYARAFHAHSFIEYHFYNALAAAPNNPLVAGNPNLDRESMQSYELGYRGAYLDNKLNVDAQVFWQKVDGLVRSTAAAAPGWPVTSGGFENNNQAIVKGVELAADYRPYRWLKAYANYTYLSVDDKQVAATNDNYERQDPKHQFNIGGTFYIDDEKFLPDYVDVKFGYVSTYTTVDIGQTYTAIKVPDYVKLDVKLAKKFFDDKMEVALIGLNLWEDDRIEFHDSTTSTVEIPRQYFATVKCEF